MTKHYTAGATQYGAVFILKGGDMHLLAAQIGATCPRACCNVHKILCSGPNPGRRQQNGKYDRAETPAGEFCSFASLTDQR